MSDMRVVIAPDSFKGTISALAAAEALAAGWCDERPLDRPVLLPMADGGEGTLEAFAAAVPGSSRMPVQVVGPDGREVLSAWLRLPPEAGLPGGTAVVELGVTSGIELLDTLLPLDAHTYGLGQAIAAALDAGVSRVIVGLGSSASTDGGTGMLRALGARVVDAEGIDVPLGGRGLAMASRVDVSGLAALPPGGVVALTDVTNPLLGARGAAAVFGPQKGALVADVADLEAGLARLVELVGAGAGAGAGGAGAGEGAGTGGAGVADAVADESTVAGAGAGARSGAGAGSGAATTGASALAITPGAGAAGGTGFGLLMWGATVQAGAGAVAQLIGLPEAAAAASVIITGEGSYDGQSAAGKVPAHVAALAAPGSRVALVAGRITADADTAAFTATASLTDLAGSSAGAMADPARWLREAGARFARELG